jgi:hypothetical protein
MLCGRILDDADFFALIEPLLSQNTTLTTLHTQRAL